MFIDLFSSLLFLKPGSVMTYFSVFNVCDKIFHQYAVFGVNIVVLAHVPRPSISKRERQVNEDEQSEWERRIVIPSFFLHADKTAFGTCTSDTLT